MNLSRPEDTTIAENVTELARDELHADDRLLRLREVLQLIPLSRSTWWSGVNCGRFPKPVRLGPRIVAWRFCDIRQILEKGVA
jgi:prophage regulatory protein